MTVADKIGDEYKNWENYNKVFIAAPTGTGKTYFILNVLLPYACSQNKRILFLVNRKILKEQIKADIHELTDDSYKNIEVETYQALERRISEIRVFRRNDIVNIGLHFFLKNVRV